MTRTRRRRAFALTAVLANLALLFTFWSLANRQTAALMAMEAAMERRQQRHRGSLVAVARGVALLETGTPTTEPYTCGTDVDTPRGTLTYTVTFDKVSANQWTVVAAPTPEGETPTPMPTTFAPPSGGP